MPGKVIFIQNEKKVIIGVGKIHQNNKGRKSSLMIEAIRF